MDANVGVEPRHADETAARGEVHDVSAAALPHSRQERLGHRDEADDVGFELGSDLIE
nr:hypothetical protein [Rhodococcus sp. T7]